jgi:hypothetical protein
MLLHASRTMDLQRRTEYRRAVSTERKDDAMSDENTRPDADELPDGAASDGSAPEPGEDTSSGGGPDEHKPAQGA